MMMLRRFRALGRWLWPFVKQGNLAESVAVRNTGSVTQRALGRWLWPSVKQGNLAEPVAVRNTGSVAQRAFGRSVKQGSLAEVVAVRNTGSVALRGCLIENEILRMRWFASGRRTARGRRIESQLIQLPQTACPDLSSPPFSHHF